MARNKWITEKEKDRIVFYYCEKKLSVKNLVEIFKRSKETIRKILIERKVWNPDPFMSKIGTYGNEVIMRNKQQEQKSKKKILYKKLKFEIDCLNNTIDELFREVQE